MKTLNLSIFLFAAVLVAGCSMEQESPGDTKDPLEQCYSPTQNLDWAYDDGAEGCACDEGSAGQCVADSQGRNVALVCEDGRWLAVEDGPCSPPGP